MTTGTITLPPQLLDPLQSLASERGRSVDGLVQDLIGEFLREQRHARLMAEMERYRAQHAALLATYSGRYIGLYDGKVLGDDEDGSALYARLRRQHDDWPILIVQVTETPEQEVTVRNPGLEMTE